MALSTLRSFGVVKGKRLMLRPLPGKPTGLVQAVERLADQMARGRGWMAREEHQMTRRETRHTRTHQRCHELRWRLWEAARSPWSALGVGVVYLTVLFWVAWVVGP